MTNPPPPQWPHYEIRFCDPPIMGMWNLVISTIKPAWNLVIPTRIC